MSLINQMLQELDARRAEGAGSTGYGQQVRAVAERRNVHPAWWVALVLTVILLSVLGWMLLRTVPAPTLEPVVRRQLPLKLDANLDPVAVAAPVPKTGQPDQPVPAPLVPASSPAVPAPPVEPAPVIPANANASPGPGVSTPLLPVMVQPPQVQPAPQPMEKSQPRPAVTAKIHADIKPSATVRSTAETSPAPQQRAKEVAPAAESTGAAPVPKSSEQDIPPSGHKHVKELTSQQRAENEYRKALMAAEQAKTGEALSALQLALQMDAQHGAARQTLIGLLLDSKRQDEAMRVAREGLALDLAQPGLAMILARLQLEKGELRGGIETLRRTLPHAQDRADYLAFLAALLQRDEQHKQAAEHYFQALNRSPQTGVWWMGLGISLQADQRKMEAQEAFRRAKGTNTLTPELTAFVESRLNQLQY